MAGTTKQKYRPRKESMELEDLTTKMESEVNSYNELIEQLNALDQERQAKLARIQVLQELIEDKKAENARDEAMKGVKNADAEE